MSGLGVMLFAFISDIDSGVKCTFDDTKLCGAVKTLQGDIQKGLNRLERGALRSSRSSTRPSVRF